jgi:hypothetical protein
MSTKAEPELLKSGRQKSIKKTVSVRFMPDTLIKIRHAVAATGNLSVWVERACLERLRLEKQLQRLQRENERTSSSE